MDLSILSALMGGVGDENTYIAQNPWAQAGRGIAGIQTAAPRNNTEAFLMPFLQSSLAGALSGYGKNQAQQAQYGDLRNLVQSPLLADALAEDPNLTAMFTAEDRPADFSAKAAKNELLLAALKQEGIDQFERKKQEKQAELEFDIKKAQNQELMDAEAERARLIEEAKNSVKPEKQFELPPAMLTETSKSKSLIDESLFIAKELENVKSWADLQKSKAFSGLDTDGIALQMKNLADRYARVRTGAALNKSEEALYDQLVGGDLTADPKQASKLLKKLASAEVRIMDSTLGFAEELGTKGPAAVRQALKQQIEDATTESDIPAGAQLTNKTSGGKPVYIVNGKYWVK